MKEDSRITSFLKANPSVKFIRIHWVDLSGVLRVRFVPVARLFDFVTGKLTYILSQNCMITPLSTAPKCFAPGPESWIVHPDLSSLRVCGQAPDHAALFCTLTQEEPTGSRRFAKCPRALLQHVLSQFYTKHGVQFRVGFEIEFVLLDNQLKPAQPLDNLAAWNFLGGFRGTFLDVMNDILAALERSGVEVYHFHCDAKDQLEIALMPLPVLEAVDTLLLAQETIRAVAFRHNLRASVAPRPVLDGPINGCHMNISFNDAALGARLERSFIAGILENLEAICAFAMPNYDSYIRVQDDGAGTLIGWGTNNRDLPIRRVGSRWELRIIDATANMFLVVALALAAGLAGIEDKTPLRWGDCQEFTTIGAEELKSRYGIDSQMPRSLRETVDAAKANPRIREWIGAGLFDQYIAIKEKEVEVFPRMSEEERRQRYLEYF